jgi:hypothetical protein
MSEREPWQVENIALRCFRPRTSGRKAVETQRVSTFHAAPLVRGADGAAHRPPPCEPFGFNGSKQLAS